MRTKIEVLKADIRKGRCQDPSNCAVARAIFRKLKPKVYAVGVVRNQVHLQETPESKWHFIMLPKFVSRFIDRFDGGNRKLKPISFCINVNF